MTGPRVAAGLDAWRRGEFFAAHEALEDAWRAATGPTRACLRGLIQVAVGCHHASRGNARGAVALLRRGAAALRPLGPACAGLALAPCASAAERLADAIVRHGATAPALADPGYPPPPEPAA